MTEITSESSNNVFPEHCKTIYDKCNWFHLQAGCAVDRLLFLAKLNDFPSEWADWVFLVVDELERQCDAFGDCIPDILQIDQAKQQESKKVSRLTER